MKLQEMMIKQFCKIDRKQENAHVRRCLHIANKHYLIEFNYSKKLTMYTYNILSHFLLAKSNYHMLITHHASL